MANLKEILKEEYNKQGKINFKNILEMVDEVIALKENFESFISLDEKKKSNQQQMFSGKKTISTRAIPAPSVSELGWASLNSNDEGAMAKREELEQYLRTIEGSDLRVKLNTISKMLTDPSRVKELPSYGETQGQKIASVLAYLVFLKTLTTVITNFNASSAGFNFEAFLAVLLGGQQIPAAGADTIADITADGIPISLKLYNEKTLKAGGSYNALIGDLVKRPKAFMRYVVATKTLEGDDLQRQGQIGVFQYDLTSENVIEILYRSAPRENSELIRLPASVVSGERGLEFKIPKLPGVEQIEAKFYEIVKGQVGNVPWLDDLRSELGYLSNNKLFRGNKIGRDGFKFHKKETGTPTKKSPVLELVTNFLEQNQIEGVDPVQLATILGAAQEKAKEIYFKAVKAKDEVGEGLGKFASSEASREFFNNLDEKQRRRALLMTLGYVTSGNQYELTRADIYNIENLAGNYRVFGKGQSEIKIGEIEIGLQALQSVFDELVDDVNRTVFEIFDEMANLSENLQGYFAGGLADNSKANDAISSARKIGEKTEETKDIK
tara:strand:- start:2618 stop:4276 length:1659 start_codon:yes stop_codon:yes gene_type:complete